MTMWPAEAIVFRAIPGDGLLDALAFKPQLIYVFAADHDSAVVTIHVLAEVWARRIAD